MNASKHRANVEQTPSNVYFEYICSTFVRCLLDRVNGVLFTTVAVYIAWRDDRVSVRATCVILSLIVTFKSNVSLTNVIACMELFHL